MTLTILPTPTTFDIGERNNTLSELLEFAEIACAFDSTDPLVFHEVWQLAKERRDIDDLMECCVIPESHPWKRDKNAWRVAKGALPFFYTQRLVDNKRMLYFRPQSIEEIAYGEEKARGLIRIAFAKYF